MADEAERVGLQLEAAEEPFALFAKWMDDARHSELNDPNAMALALSTPDGVPSVRIVLCKRYDERGFTFYTNAESRKGREIAANSHAALCFHWKSRQRQVRVEGVIRELGPEDADAYFKRRFRMSQIGAWASQQSRPLGSREDLMAATDHFEHEFPNDVPRPEYWRGFLVEPAKIEFWQEGDFRLHDRFVFARQSDSGWQKERLYP